MMLAATFPLIGCIKFDEGTLKTIVLVRRRLCERKIDCACSPDNRALFLEIPEELKIVLLKGLRRAVRRVILMNTIELLQIKVS